MLSNDNLMFYGISGNHEFDRHTLKVINELSGHEFPFSHSGGGRFNDGEPAFKMKDNDKIKGGTTVIFGSPTGPKGEAHYLQRVSAAKLIYGARTVIAAMPFMRYRRQEREAKRNEISRLLLYINSIKSAGADHLVTCDPHSAEYTQKYCDKFGLKLHVCDPTEVYAEKIRTEYMPSLGGPENIVVLSPDLGGGIRAIKLATALGVPAIIIPKERLSGDTTRNVTDFDEAKFLQKVRKKYGKEIKIKISCDLKGIKDKSVIVCEDEISTAGTAAKIGKQLLLIGAITTILVATHPVCTAGWQNELFLHNGKNPYTIVLLSDTRKRGDEDEDKYEESTGGDVITISLAPVFASTIIDVLEKIAA